MTRMTLVAACTAMALLAGGSAFAQDKAEKMPAHSGTMAKPAMMKEKEPKTQKEACELEAKDKKLKGDEKKSFMKDCTAR